MLVQQHKNANTLQTTARMVCNDEECDGFALAICSICARVASFALGARVDVDLLAAVCDDGIVSGFTLVEMGGIVG